MIIIIKYDEVQFEINVAIFHFLEFQLSCTYISKLRELKLK